MHKINRASATEFNSIATGDPQSINLTTTCDFTSPNRHHGLQQCLPSLPPPHSPPPDRPPHRHSHNHHRPPCPQPLDHTRKPRLGRLNEPQEPRQGRQGGPQSAIDPLPSPELEDAASPAPQSHEESATLDHPPRVDAVQAAKDVGGGAGAAEVRYSPFGSGLREEGC